MADDVRQLPKLTPGSYAGPGKFESLPPPLCCCLFRRAPRRWWVQIRTIQCPCLRCHTRRGNLFKTRTTIRLIVLPIIAARDLWRGSSFSETPTRSSCGDTVKLLIITIRGRREAASSCRVYSSWTIFALGHPGATTSRCDKRQTFHGVECELLLALFSDLCSSASLTNCELS